MKNQTKKVMLVGEGIHQHTLYGNFQIEENVLDFAPVKVIEDSELRHEKPTGEFAEHNTLIIEKGDWVMGKQVEYNPFSQKIERIWD